MFTIHATKRKERGKGASRRLRAANRFPAVVYGGNEEAVSIELDHNVIANIQTKPEFYSEILTLVIDGQDNKVKAQAVQRHAFKPKILHMDFLRVQP